MSGSVNEMRFNVIGTFVHGLLLIVTLVLVVYFGVSNFDDSGNGATESRTDMSGFISIDAFFTKENVPEVYNKPLYATTCSPEAPEFSKIVTISRQQASRIQERSAFSECPTLVTGGSAIHHACCISDTKYRALTKAHDKNDQIVYPVQSSYLGKQYFEIQTCRHVSPCNKNCECRQESYLTPALVYNPGYGRPLPSGYGRPPPYVIRTLKLPGCCKCANI